MSKYSELVREMEARIAELEEESIRRGDQLVQAAGKIHEYRKRANEWEAALKSAADSLDNAGFHVPCEKVRALLAKAESK